jgi:large conductance mechanosensitive channel
MSMMSEFREFAVKGNVMDLAVGVIIGGAFGKIVDSIVGDLIMPIVSAIIGKPDFLQPVPGAGQPSGRHADDARSAEEGRRAGVRVRQFHHRALNFANLAFIIFLMVSR